MERGASSNRKHSLFDHNVLPERTSGAQVGEWTTDKTLVKVNFVISFGRDKQIL